MRLELEIAEPLYRGKVELYLMSWVYSLLLTKSAYEGYTVRYCSTSTCRMRRTIEDWMENIVINAGAAHDNEKLGRGSGRRALGF